MVLAIPFTWHVLRQLPGRLREQRVGEPLVGHHGLIAIPPEERLSLQRAHGHPDLITDRDELINAYITTAVINRPVGLNGGLQGREEG